MGRLVRFHARHAGVEAGAEVRAEAILDRLQENYEAQQRAQTELPTILADMARGGEAEFVLRALNLWGSGELTPLQVLHMAEHYAAVCGLRQIGNRPFSEC